MSVSTWDWFDDREYFLEHLSKPGISSNEKRLFSLKGYKALFKKARITRQSRNSNVYGSVICMAKLNLPHRNRLK